MLTASLPRSWIFSPHTPRDFASCCPVCLKVWFVHGSGERGFSVHQSPCLECAYTEAAANIVGGPGWWKVCGSLLPEFESWLDRSLTRQTPTIRDILNLLPEPVIRYELACHFKDFDYYQEQKNGYD